RLTRTQPDNSPAYHARAFWRATGVRLRRYILHRFVWLRRHWLLLAALSYLMGAASALILLYLPSQSSPINEGSVPAPSATGTRVNVEPISQNVLVLPRVSRAFIGRWHGVIRIKRASGKPSHIEERDVGLALSDKDGDVVLGVAIWGGEGFKVIRSGARVL